MNVRLQYAEEHLADLLSAAEGGEPLEISRPGKRTLMLVVSNMAAPASVEHQGKRVLGAGVGRMRPISFEEWQVMDADIESITGDAPLVTSGEI